MSRERKGWLIGLILRERTGWEIGIYYGEDRLMARTG